MERQTLRQTQPACHSPEFKAACRWVLRRLVPCLKAGGAEVLIDRDRFEAAKALVGQMDSTQDEADASVLVFSPEYLGSKP